VFDRSWELKSAMRLRAAAAIASRRGLERYNKVAQAHEVLEICCDQKSPTHSRVMDAAAIASIRGLSSTLRVANDHDVLAICWLPKWVHLRIASAEIASKRGK